MATQKTTRKTRKTSQKRRIVAVEAPAKTQTSFPWLTVILGALLLVAIFVIASGPFQSPLVTQSIWKEPQVATATEAPAQTEETPVATEEAVAEPAQPQACRAINDYQLQDLPELSVEPGGFLHVEWYVKDGDPERESVLPSGRYLIKTPLRGHVWEYSPSCTAEQVLDQVAGQIERRVDVGANNAGFAPWQEWLVGKGLIEIVKMTSTSVIPTALNPTK